MMLRYAIVFSLLAMPALAQNSVLQSGPTTQYDLPGYVGDRTVQPDTQQYTNRARGWNPPHFYTPNGKTMIFEDALTTAPSRHRAQFGHDATGTFIMNFDGVGTTGQGCKLELSGVFYPCLPAVVAGLPVIADTATMKLTSTATYGTVLRQESVATAGSPPTVYDNSNSACTFPDDGAQIASLDGKCWIARFAGRADWRQWGATLGSADNAAVGQNALNAAYRQGLDLYFDGNGSYTFLSELYYYNGMHIGAGPNTILHKVDFPLPATITIANPAVITRTAHGLHAGQAVNFSNTGGALPAALLTQPTYFVIPAGLTANAFEVSTVPNGTALSTGGNTQSGTQNIIPGYALLKPASCIYDNSTCTAQNGGRFVTYTNAFSGLHNNIFDNLTIDLDFSPGAGLFLQGVSDAIVLNSNIYNVASKGWWPIAFWGGSEANNRTNYSYLPNAALICSGGGPANCENVFINSGSYGNSNSLQAGSPYNFTKCTELGWRGIAFIDPPAALNDVLNPGNANIIYNASADCDQVGMEFASASDNDIVNGDTSFSGDVGLSMGTWSGITGTATTGHYDLLINGTTNFISGSGDHLVLTLRSTKLTPNPTVIDYAPTSGLNLNQLCAGFTAAINAGVTGQRVVAYCPALIDTTFNDRVVVTVEFDEAPLLDGSSVGSAQVTYGGTGCADGTTTLTLADSKAIGSAATIQVVVSGGVAALGPATVITGGDYAIFPNNDPHLAGCTIPPTLRTQLANNPLNFEISSSGADGTSILSVAHGSGNTSVSHMQSEGNRLAMFGLGPNVQTRYIVDNPGSFQSTPNLILGNHAGAFGAQNPFIEHFTSSQSRGTAVTNSFLIDCENDRQPYSVNTTNGAITGTFVPNSKWGTVCEFLDTAGTFATHNLTLATTSGYGTATIKGSGSPLALSTAYAPARFINDGGNWVPYYGK